MKFKLAFAIHNHQPVGNFAAVFDKAHKSCYLPFLEMAKRYPSFRFSLHQSGILWDWQKEHYPEFFSLVGEMVDSGQIELLGGGFYEPILPSIPDRDKSGQLNLQSEYLKKHFEIKPRGMWLAERVWEPDLPRILHDAGLHYLPLDDTHFMYAGLNEHQMFGSYITEEAGKTVTLLPILKQLRYLIPFGTHEELINYLGAAANSHPDGMAVYADDGEKFGIWPRTFEHCYNDGWLKRFFEVLEENSDWLEVVPLGDAVASAPPLGRAYLPTASYSEMLHWSLPADSVVALEDFETRLKENHLIEEYGHFVRGGHWRGFLSKYPEVNLMHKKMLAVSDMYENACRDESFNQAALTKARDLLYAGQCNCPYWHGVFGGLYLPHLRWAIYDKLIKAEKILRGLTDTQIAADFEDRDRDGSSDISLNGSTLSMVMTPVRGGQIVELCDLERNVNLSDCLTRRREGYHKKLLNLAHEHKQADTETRSIHDIFTTKEEGLEKLLVDDWYLRRSLTDHFLAEGTSLDQFMMNRYIELGDFILEPFEPSFVENDNSFQVTLTRNGHVWQGDYHCPVNLQKIITFPKNGALIDIEYRIIQHKIEIMPIRFGVEFDFNLMAPDAEDRFVEIDGAKPAKHHLAGIEESRRALSVAYRDEYLGLGLALTSDTPCTIWRSPIYTVSLSEDGFEKTFQGNSTIMLYDKALKAGEEFSFKLTLYAGSLEKMPGIHSQGQHTVKSL